MENLEQVEQNEGAAVLQEKVLVERTREHAARDRLEAVFDEREMGGGRRTRARRRCHETPEVAAALAAFALGNAAIERAHRLALRLRADRQLRDLIGEKSALLRARGARRGGSCPGGRAAR